MTSWRGHFAIVPPDSQTNVAIFLCDSRQTFWSAALIPQLLYLWITSSEVTVQSLKRFVTAAAATVPPVITQKFVVWVATTPPKMPPPTMVSIVTLVMGHCNSTLLLIRTESWSTTVITSAFEYASKAKTRIKQAIQDCNKRVFIFGTPPIVKIFPRMGIFDPPPSLGGKLLFLFFFYLKCEYFTFFFVFVKVFLIFFLYCQFLRII